jgi:hypothetical protein
MPHITTLCAIKLSQIVSANRPGVAMFNVVRLNVMAPCFFYLGGKNFDKINREKSHITHNPFLVRNALSSTRH